MKYQDKLQEMLNDPSVRNWIKPVARKLQDHDPVDALNDCLLLVEMCKARLQQKEVKLDPCPEDGETMVHMHE